MAAHQNSAIFLAILAVCLLISPSHSLKCTSQTFTNNKLYSKCVDLPYLSAFLHWTYDSAKSSLSIAYIAPPAKSDGWIAWAINPTGTGMVGAQALIAFKQSSGSMTVQTFNISSYSSIAQSKIAFNVSDTEAEHSGGVMKLFATLALPEKMTLVNQVWQVGGSVSGGVPQKHEFNTANLNAMGPLDLTKGANSGGGSPSASPAASPSQSTPGPSSPSSATPTAPAPSVASKMRNSFAGFPILLLFIARIVFGF